MSDSAKTGGGVIGVSIGAWTGAMSASTAGGVGLVFNSSDIKICFCFGQRAEGLWVNALTQNTLLYFYSVSPTSIFLMSSLVIPSPSSRIILKASAGLLR